MSGTWQEGMALGISEIDADHRRIAGIFDALHGALVGHADATAVIAILNELVDVMCEHIGREEELMRAIRYKNTAAHRLDHDEFINMLSTLMVDYQTENHQIVIDTASLIKTWKYEHLRRFDQPLAAAILAARARVEA